MRNLKKSLSLILALALVISSVFVGGITASAAELTLDSTINTYDDPEGYGLTAGTYDNQPVILSHKSADDPTLVEDYYYFGAYGATVTQDPLNIETDTTVVFDRAKAQTNAWPAYTRIYKGGTAKYDGFKAKANTTYEISLYYYSASVPAGQVNLQVRQHTSTRYINVTHSDDKVLVPDLVEITGVTDGWTKVTGRFTTGDTSQYLFLMLTSTGSAVSGLQVYIDDVQVNECAELTVHNYDGENDKVVPASVNTTLAELDMPTRDGYILTGVYSNAELTNKLNASDLALNYVDTGVYYGWAKLNPGEYYVGFENYKTDINGKSYDSATTAIVSGNTYAGGYNIKVNAPANSLNAFELRDKEALDTKAGTNYVISFRYRSTAAAKLYAGTAAASDVPGTATAIQGADLPAAADWTAASIEVTLNKGQLEGYVPVFMVQATEAATVEFDHIYLTYPVEETQNIENKFVTSKDWYPSLAYFGGITIPEASAVWTGETELPADANGDGVYEIDTAEKLAYVIKNGGTLTLEDSTVVENGSFILTKDIYLNDISKANWLADENNSSVTPWYNNTTAPSFSGTIDGNFHAVYGLYSRYQYTNTSHNITSGYGFIPAVMEDANAVVKNLTIDCANVFGSGNAAAFVGLVDRGSAEIDSCTVGSNVYVEGYRAGAFVGTVSYYGTSTVTISNCASYATTVVGAMDETNLNRGWFSYGLVNNTWSSGAIIVRNSFNANGPITSRDMANFVVSNSFATQEGNVTTGAVILTKEQMQGTNVLSVEGTMPILNSNGNYWTATNEYPVLSASRGIEVQDLGVWDGTRIAPTNTDESGNTLISTPEELAYVIYNGGVAGATYKLTNNIFLNNIDLINWETGVTASGYTPNAWYKNRAFQGTLDGDGYSVYGLYYTDNSTREEMTSASGTVRYNYVGLIPGTGSGTSVSVLSLGVDYMYINFYAAAAPFIGKAGDNGTKPTIVVDQCYSGENVYVTAGMAACVVGADIAASHKYTNIASNANIYSSTVSFDPEQAVFLGNSWGPTWNGHYNNYNSVGSIVNRAYSARDTVHNKAYCNYAVGYFWAESAEKSWHAKRLSSVELMKGLNALENMPNLNLDWETQTATTMFTATESFPIPTVMVGKMYVKPEVKDNIVIGGGEEDSETSIWDGTSVAPTVGAGTEDNPWKIYTGAELYYVVKNQGGDGVYYQLQNDIYLNDITKVNWHTGSIADGYTVHKWISGGSAVFNGHLDGNGYGVYGIYIHDGKTDYSSTPSYATGLIPRTTAGGNVTVKNIEVDYMFSRYDSITGPIIGSVHSADTTIENCFVGQNVYANSSYVGNLVGYVYGSDITLNVKNCYSLSSGYANTGHYAFLGYTHWDYVPNINLVNCYNAGGRMISENRSPFTATNCYEAEDGGLNTGVTTISKDNMKGADVLMSSAKMAGLKMASAYIKNDASFATANANNYVYLPAGTVLEEDFAPLFFDNRMAPLDADKVLFVDRMIRGAYVKFEKEVDVTKIHVPVSKAHRVAFGTAQELLNAGYYDLETEVIKENLADQPDTAVNYIFITDPHFDTSGDVGPISPDQSAKQYALAIKMANEMEEIDFVALGGDLTNGGYGTSDAWITALNGYLAETANCTKPVFILVGNHDDNAYGTVSDSVTHADFSAKIISPDEWQSTIIDQFVNRTLADGTVIEVSQNVDPYDNSKVNSKYYYYDLDNKNTRVICLNASDYEYAYDENGEFTLINNSSTSANVRSNTYNGYNFWGYSKYQMKWLAEEALGTLPEDYNIIVLSHMAITADRNGQTYVNGTVLSDIMGAYQNKTAYTHDGYGISADFTGDTGRIMAYQHGHEHVVYDKYNADCDVWQFSSANPNPHGSLATVMNENVASTDVMSVTEGYAYKQALGKGDTAMYINNLPVFEGDVTFDQITDIRDLVALRNLNTAGLATAIVPDGDYAKIRKLLIGA
ncbi:MAG: metallophosphoesterase [Clostridia bacterium]|nr:metallophosphoesterase [Clostridia bacterium]